MCSGLVWRKVFWREDISDSTHICLCIRDKAYGDWKYTSFSEDVFFNELSIWWLASFDWRLFRGSRTAKWKASANRGSSAQLCPEWRPGCWLWSTRGRRLLTTKQPTIIITVNTITEQRVGTITVRLWYVRGRPSSRGETVPPFVLRVAKWYTFWTLPASLRAITSNAYQLAALNVVIST